MTGSQNNFIFSAKGVDEAVLNAFDYLEKDGKRVDAPKFSNKPDATLELQNFQFSISNPLNRIATNPLTPLNVISSIGRFTWMVAGNDRLEDIAFYQDKVKPYTDDGLTVPGSSYGKRIFNSPTGNNQIANVIRILKEDPNSRRATVPIWTHEDSLRLGSNDIPCAFGLSFLVRENQLHTTLMMRSNHAHRLLATNIFEFSLVGEIVARELGLEYGKYTHYTVSLHISENNLEKIRNSIGKIKPNNFGISMPRMPSEPSPMDEVRKLAILEASLRNDNVLKNPDNLKINLANARHDLNEYWYEFFKVLAINALVHAEENGTAMKLADELEPWFKEPVKSYLEKFYPVTNVIGSTLDPFFTNVPNDKFEKLQEAFTPDDEETKNIIEILHKYTDEYEKSKHVEISRKEYQKLEAKHLNKVIVAARSTGPETSSEDLRKISKEEVWKDIDEILSGNGH